MKKIKVLALIVSILLLCSCTTIDGKDINTNQIESGNNSPRVVAYLSGLGDSNTIEGLAIEKISPFYSDGYLNESDNVLQEESVTHNGETYIGTYRYTNSYPVNKKVDVYGTNNLFFGIDRETKQLEFILGAELYENVTMVKEQNITNEKCVEIANDFAKKYINIEDYEVSASEFSDNVELIAYKRAPFGLQTFEYMLIQVSNATGKVLGFEKQMIGAFSKEELSNQKRSIDSLVKDSKAVSNEKIESVCKEICEKKDIISKALVMKAIFCTDM